jgi:hypothetical protein
MGLCAVTVHTPTSPWLSQSLFELSTPNYRLGAYWVKVTKVLFLRDVFVEETGKVENIRLILVARQYHISLRLLDTLRTVPLASLTASVPA